MFDVIVVLMGILSLFDMMVLAINRAKNNESPLWLGIHVITGFMLVTVWLALGIIYKMEPIWLNYIMASMYTILTIARYIASRGILSKIDIEEKFVDKMLEITEKR